MPVIALTQEMGSLAKDVAVELAAALKLELMRHEVVEHVAEKMNMPKSAIRRLREGKAGFMERMTTDQQGMALYTAEQVFELANKGNVVLRGWGATCLLSPVPHVPCIRITRSFKKRVEWLMAHLETDDMDFAEAEIRRSDEAHASRMHQQFGVTWGDPLLYDLVINTDRISVASCVEQIRQLVSRHEFQETAESRAVLANLTLNARILATLRANEATRDIRISVTSSGGVASLNGIVMSAKERSETEQVTAAVPGVSGVDNQLRLMAKSTRFTSAKY